MLRLSDASQQLDLLDESIHDERPSTPTGFGSLDSLLRRGGLLPGNLVLLGGRTGTRKTTLMTNMMVNMAHEGIGSALVTLDEPPWAYVVKLLSTWADMPQDRVEAVWDDDEGKSMRSAWKKFAGGLIHMFGGRRPAPEHLSAAMDMAALGGDAPKVIFIDYLQQMTRAGDYKYGDKSRLPLLMEDLGIWSTDNGVIVVALHQLSRNDEFGGNNSRNAGHIPVTLTQLKYAGEEAADLVLGTYRPAMDPLGLMSRDAAKLVLGERFDDDEYWERRSLVKKYEKSTFLQLLKNRPGTHREERGIELISDTESLLMVEKDAEEPEREDADEQDQVSSD